MKEQALTLVRDAADRGRALNVLREYLQALVLRSFHESEAFRSLAFVGGTALRFLHGLPRFSEDLDFSLVLPQGYAGQAWMAKVKRDLTLAGFTPEVTWKDRKTVHTGWVRLRGLLHEAGLERRAINGSIAAKSPSRRSIQRTGWDASAGPRGRAAPEIGSAPGGIRPSSHRRSPPRRAAASTPPAAPTC